MDYPSVLIATPTYAGKGYALDEYVAAVAAQDYQGCFEMLLVDNTPGTQDYFDRIAALDVPVKRIEPHEEFGHTHYCALRTINNFAIEQKFDLVLSLEQDIIIPPEGLRLMVERLIEDDLCVLLQEYPPRPSTGYTGMMAENGCTLYRWDDFDAAITAVTRPGLPGINFAEAAIAAAHDYAVVNLFKAEHREGDQGPWTFTDADPRYAAGATNTDVQYINPHLDVSAGV